MLSFHSLGLVQSVHLLLSPRESECIGIDIFLSRRISILRLCPSRSRASDRDTFLHHPFFMRLELFRVPRFEIEDQLLLQTVNIELNVVDVRLEPLELLKVILIVLFEVLHFPQIVELFFINDFFLLVVFSHAKLVPDLVLLLLLLVIESLFDFVHFYLGTVDHVRIVLDLTALVLHILSVLNDGRFQLPSIRVLLFVLEES